MALLDDSGWWLGAKGRYVQVLQLHDAEAFCSLLESFEKCGRAYCVDVSTGLGRKRRAGGSVDLSWSG